MSLPPLVVRRRHRQVGFGDYTDFGSLIAAEPAAARAWQMQVQSQLTAEGNGPGSPVAQVAQGHFYNVWSNLASVVPTGGSTGNAALGTIANAAATLTVQNNTSAGAVHLAEGLVQGAIDGNPAEIMQAFTGSLCAFAGAEVAAGTISFGIGAAIMVGIELVGDLLSNAFFSKAPVVATVCGAQITGTKPGIIVNCVFSQGQPVSPGYGQLGSSTAPQSNPFWRRFPEPSNSADAWWFQAPLTSMSTTAWTSGKSTDIWTLAGQGVRPIDAAFPQYHQLECDAAAAYPVAALYDTGNATYSSDDVMFARFILAYFGAWKANAEFSLNGMAPTYATDADVLMGGTGGLGGAHGFWNAAHQPGAGVTLTPKDTNKGFTDVIKYPSPCAGTFESEWWYVSMLLNDAGVNSLSVNTGPNVSYATATGSSSGMSTTKKVAIGAAGAVGSVAFVGTAGAVGLAAYQGLPWHHYLSTGAARLLGRR